jgi:hypothetical protein
MATPNNVQQNILTAMQTMAIQLIELRYQLALVSQMYTNELLANLVDADIQMLPEFAGVAAVELSACKQAFDAIVTTIGDPGVAATNAYKILKIANKVP